MPDVYMVVIEDRFNPGTMMYVPSGKGSTPFTTTIPKQARAMLTRYRNYGYNGRAAIYAINPLTLKIKVFEEYP